MTEIINILNEVKPGIDYENETGLITNGIITSFDLVLLVSLLNDRLGVNITVVDLIPENFETVKDIENLVNKLK